MNLQPVGLPVLSQNNLEVYISAVMRIPLLSEEEERCLAFRLRLEGDVDAAKVLVLSHLKVVVRLARDYAGYGLPLADLIQEGTVGLMKAVRRFDPTRGVRLFSFAIHWIRAEIHDFILRNWRLVRIATTKAQKKLFFNLRSMKKSDGIMSAREAQAIAQELGVKEKEVLAMEERFASPEVPLEGGDDDNAQGGPIAALPDPAQGPLEVLAQREEEVLEAEGLSKAMSVLDDRSREIIKARFLSERPATLVEIGDTYGISAERVRQIEKSALSKMKKSFPALTRVT